MLQADSCCKSSHSWREAGSPRLICLTSNITNHLGPGNISFSSSLCLFSSLSVFAACLTVTSSPPVSYPWSFTSFWSFLVSSMCLSGGKTSGGGGRREGVVLFLALCPQDIMAVMTTMKWEGGYRFSSFFSFSLQRFFIFRCHSRTSALPPRSNVSDSWNFHLLLSPPLEYFREDGNTAAQAVPISVGLHRVSGSVMNFRIAVWATCEAL